MISSEKYFFVKFNFLRKETIDLVDAYFIHGKFTRTNWWTSDIFAPIELAEGNC